MAGARLRVHDRRERTHVLALGCSFCCSGAGLLIITAGG